MGIGGRLSTLLKARGMTVTELARKVNVAPTTVYSIIQRDNKKVDIDVLLNIADALDVKAEYFRESPLQRQQADILRFSSDDYTPTELEEIKSFAEYVRGKRDRQQIPPPKKSDN